MIDENKIDIVARLQVAGLDEAARQINSTLANRSVGVNVAINQGAQSAVNSLSQSLAGLHANLGNIQTSASGAAGSVSNFSRASAAAVTQFQNLNSAGASTSAMIQNIGRNVSLAENSLNSFSFQTGLAARRFTAFTLAAGTLIKLSQSMRDGASHGIRFQNEMVRISQVSGESLMKLSALGNEISRVAKNYGVLGRDLTEAAVVFKQAGLSANEVQKALEAMGKAALSPNFGSMAQSAEGSIAILAQFKGGVDSLEASLGSINAVAGEFAVESSDLITVIQKAGGAFKSAGGSLDELLGLFTAVRATTRESAEEISTGLRTIFGRLQREDTVRALKEMQIELRHTAEEAVALGDINLTNQFVKPMEAIRRISEGLSGIQTTDPQYARVAELIGGTRQLSRVIPLLQEFATAQKAVQVAQSGTTSLDAAAIRSQESLQVQLIKTKEHFLDLFRAISTDKAFTSTISQILTLTNGMLDLASAMKPVLPLFGAIVGGGIVRSLTTGTLATAGSFFGRGAIKGTVPRYASGDLVRGPGNDDTIDAKVMPGEFIFTRLATQRIGVNRLRDLHERGKRGQVGIQHFAAGGQVRRYASGGTVQRFAAGDVVHPLFADRSNLERMPVGNLPRETFPDIHAEAEAFRNELKLTGKSIEGLNHFLLDFSGESPKFAGFAQSVADIQEAVDAIKGGGATAGQKTVEVFHGGTLRPGDEPYPLTHFGTEAAARKAIAGDPAGKQLVKGTFTFSNPATMTDSGRAHNAERMAEDLTASGVNIPNLVPAVRQLAKTDGEEAARKALAAVLAKKGYDAIEYKNANEDAGSTSYVSLLPGQFQATGTVPFESTPTPPASSQPVQLAENKRPVRVSKQPLDVTNPQPQWASLNQEFLSAKSVKEQVDLLFGSGPLGRAVETNTRQYSKGNEEIASELRLKLIEKVNSGQFNFDPEKGDISAYVGTIFKNARKEVLTGLQTAGLPTPQGRVVTLDKDIIGELEGLMSGNLSINAASPLASQIHKRRTNKRIPEAGGVTLREGSQVLVKGKKLIRFQDEIVKAVSSDALKQDTDEFIGTSAHLPDGSRFGSGKDVLSDVAEAEQQQSQVNQAAQFLRSLSPEELKQGKYQSLIKKLDPESALYKALQNPAPQPVRRRYVSAQPVSVSPVNVQPVSVSPVNVQPVSGSPVNVQPASVPTETTPQQSPVAGNAGWFRRVLSTLNPFSKQSQKSTPFELNQDTLNAALVKLESLGVSPFAFGADVKIVDDFKSTDGVGQPRGKFRQEIDGKRTILLNRSKLDTSEKLLSTLSHETGHAIDASQGTKTPLASNDATTSFNQIGNEYNQKNSEELLKRFQNRKDYAMATHEGFARAFSEDVVRAASGQQVDLSKYMKSVPVSVSSTGGGGSGGQPPTTTIISAPDPNPDRENQTENTLLAARTSKPLAGKSPFNQRLESTRKRRTPTPKKSGGGDGGGVAAGGDGSGNEPPEFTDFEIIAEPTRRDERAARLARRAARRGVTLTHSNALESVDAMDARDGAEKRFYNNQARVGYDSTFVREKDSVESGQIRRGRVDEVVFGDRRIKDRSASELLRSRTEKAVDGEFMRRGGRDVLSNQTRSTINERISRDQHEKMLQQLIAAEQRNIMAINKNVSSSEAYKMAQERATVAMSRAGQKAGIRIVTDQQGGIVGTNRSVAQATAANPGFTPTGQTGFWQNATNFMNGQPIVPGNGRFSKFLNSRNATTLAVAGGTILPIVASQASSAAGTAGDAVLTGRESRYKYTQAAVGAVSGGVAGAFLGAQLGGPFAPYTAAIGAAVGATAGFVTALRSAETEISNVKLENSLSDFQNVLGRVQSVAGPIKGTDVAEIRQSLTDRQGLVTERNRKASVSFFEGFNEQDFNARQRSSIRNDFGGQLPQISSLLANQATQLGKASAGTGKSTEDLSKELSSGNEGLNRELLNIVASIRGVPISQVLKELEKNIKAGADSIKFQADNRRSNQAVADTIGSFGRLVLSVQSASDAVRKMRDQADLTASLFQGTVSSAKVTANAEVFDQFGRNDAGLTAALGTVRSVGGEQGESMFKFGSVLDRVAGSLPNILSSAAARNVEDASVGDAVRTELMKSLGYEPGQAPKEVGQVIDQLVDRLNKDVADKPGAFRESVGIDSTGYAERLLSPLIGPLKEAGQKIARQLEDNANQFNDGLTRLTQMMTETRELRVQGANASLDSAFSRAGIAARRRGEDSSFGINSLTLSQMETPQNTRLQQMLTNSGVSAENLNNPAALGARLKELTGENGLIFQQQEKLQQEFVKDPSSEAAKAAATELNRLKDGSAGLIAALKQLSNGASQAAAAQQKLGSLEAEQNSRRGLVESFYSSSGAERQSMARGAALVRLAHQRGNVDGFSTSQQQLIFQTLNRLQGMTLKGLTDENGVALSGLAVKNRLLDNSAAGQALGLDSAQKSEMTALQETIQGHFDNAVKANETLVSHQEAMSSEFFNRLSSAHDAFFTRLASELAKDKTENQRRELGRKESELPDAESAAKKADFLKSQNITDASLRQFANPDVIGRLERAKEAQLAVENQQNGILSTQKLLSGINFSGIKEDFTTDFLDRSTQDTSVVRKQLEDIPDLTPEDRTGIMRRFDMQLKASSNHISFKGIKEDDAAREARFQELFNQSIADYKSGATNKYGVAKGEFFIGYPNNNEDSSLNKNIVERDKAFKNLSSAGLEAPADSKSLGQYIDALQYFSVFGRTIEGTTTNLTELQTAIEKLKTTVAGNSEPTKAPIPIPVPTPTPTPTQAPVPTSSQPTQLPTAPVETEVRLPAQTTERPLNVSGGLPNTPVTFNRIADESMPIPIGVGGVQLTPAPIPPGKAKEAEYTQDRNNISVADWMEDPTSDNQHLFRIKDDDEFLEKMYSEYEGLSQTSIQLGRQAVSPLNKKYRKGVREYARQQVELGNVPSLKGIQTNAQRVKSGLKPLPAETFFEYMTVDEREELEGKYQDAINSGAIPNPVLPHANIPMRMQDPTWDERYKEMRANATAPKPRLTKEELQEKLASTQGKGVHVTPSMKVDMQIKAAEKREEREMQKAAARQRLEEEAAANPKGRAARVLKQEAEKQKKIAAAKSRANLGNPVDYSAVHAVEFNNIGAAARTEHPLAVFGGGQPGFTEQARLSGNAAQNRMDFNRSLANDDPRFQHQLNLGTQQAYGVPTVPIAASAATSAAVTPSAPVPVPILPTQNQVASTIGVMQPAQTAIANNQQSTGVSQNELAKLTTGFTTFETSARLLSDSFSRFEKAAKELSESMQAMPESLVVEGRQEVVVHHVGVEMFQQLEPVLKGWIEEGTTRKIASVMKEYFPDAAPPA